MDVAAVKTLRLVPEGRHPRGALDTSIVIDLDRPDVAVLPAEGAVSAITMAPAGPSSACRCRPLQRADAAFDPLPFDGEAARAYGRIFAATSAAGRKARGARAVDPLIAATALAAGLSLCTRNGEDLRLLEGLARWWSCVDELRPHGLSIANGKRWKRADACGLKAQVSGLAHSPGQPRMQADVG